MTDRRVIAVTGASRGIGAAIAEELARRGYLVGCLSRKGIGPEERPASPTLAASSINLACDVTDEARIKAAFAALADRAGAIHGLVNNAGLHLEGPSHEFPTADFERVMAINVTAVFVACREVYPHLLRAGGGTIINLGSFFDKLGTKYTLAYTVSKAAVASITRCLAVEWAKKNIRVLDVAPGFIATDLNKAYMRREGFRQFLERRVPVGRPGEPEEVARLIGALYDEDLPFLTGETIYIDGGHGMAH